MLKENRKITRTKIEDDFYSSLNKNISVRFCNMSPLVNYSQTISDSFTVFVLNAFVLSNFIET